VIILDFEQHFPGTALKFSVMSDSRDLIIQKGDQSAMIDDLEVSHTKAESKS
jgi:hypothetical protein